MTTHDRTFATVSRIFTLLENEGLCTSSNPLKMPTINWKISCTTEKQQQQQQQQQQQPLF
jgi:hypothetical protein